MELKPCPFCGSEVECDRRIKKGLYFVPCRNEYCTVNPATYLFDNLEDAIKAWNKRAEVRA